MACITSSNAREMAARSQEARRQRRLAEAERLAAAQEQAGLPDYVAKRLARVRVQLDRIDGMMMTEMDPQKLDRLASAQARLSEQERILDGRPMPGSFKPRTPAKAPLPDLVPE